MTNLIPREASFLGVSEIQNTHQLCQLLMRTPYYSKMQPEGVYAVVEAAKSLNIDPRLALGGGLYYVKGKVEMTARLMNSLIRKHGHSITQDERSNDTICILHGKRADTGAVWTESFSIKEAQRAGISKKEGWVNFPRDMLFARALSRLARQLFPDVIGNVYVEGEISLDPNIISKKKITDPLQEEIIILNPEKVRFFSLNSNEEVDALESLIGDDDVYRQKVLRFIKNNFLVDSFHDMPKEIYDKVYARALKNKQEREKVAQDSNEEVDALESLIGDDDVYRQKVLRFLENNGLGNSFHDMPKEIYDKVYARALKNKQEREKVTTETATPPLEKKELLTKMSNKEIADLESLIGNDDNYRQKVLCFLENNNLGRSFHDMPKEIYDKVYARALKNKQEQEKVIQDTCQNDEINQMAMGDS